MKDEYFSLLLAVCNKRHIKESSLPKGEDFVESESVFSFRGKLLEFLLSE